VFSRQVNALGRAGDVFIGISTSGKSPNIVAALNAARKLGMVNIGMTRDTATPMHALCDVTIGVPATETALIQQIHITAAHAICHLVERELFGAAKG
jgi:D-sedoheptulose 7-phosphate isomerase